MSIEGLQSEPVPRPSRETPAITYVAPVGNPALTHHCHRRRFRLPLLGLERGDRRAAVGLAGLLPRSLGDVPRTRAHPAGFGSACSCLLAATAALGALGYMAVGRLDTFVTDWPRYNAVLKRTRDHAGPQAHQRRPAGFGTDPQPEARPRGRARRGRPAGPHASAARARFALLDSARVDVSPVPGFLHAGGQTQDLAVHDSSFFPKAKGAPCGKPSIRSAPCCAAMLRATRSSP